MILPANQLTGAKTGRKPNQPMRPIYNIKTLQTVIQLTKHIQTKLKLVKLRLCLGAFYVIWLVSVAKWANMLFGLQYPLGLSGWRPAEARDQIRVAA